MVEMGIITCREAPAEHLQSIVQDISNCSAGRSTWHHGAEAEMAGSDMHFRQERIYGHYRMFSQSPGYSRFCQTSISAVSDCR
jgi:hypothetical protein